MACPRVCPKLSRALSPFSVGSFSTTTLLMLQLYRKVKALTGMTPVEILRETRLKHAMQLLKTTDKTVSEIANEVGFATPGYFSSCFKKQYDKYPTDVREEMKV